MYHKQRKHQLGISLIETLASLVIISVGLVAIAGLQGNIIALSGGSKARTEALQLAQDKLEQLRNMMEESDYTAITGGQNDNDGTNAVFTRKWTVTTQSNPPRKLIGVTVSWRNEDNDLEQVVLNTQIVFDNPVAEALSRSREDLVDEFVSPPTGGAEEGGGETPSGTQVSSNADGTSIYKEGDEYLLVDNGGVVLSTSSTGFAVICGTNYIDVDAFANLNSFHPNQFPSNLSEASLSYVVTSSNSYCTKTYDSNNYSVLAYTKPDPGPSEPGTIYLGYYHYCCYVGEGWYGNVGVVLDDSNASFDACVGDPTVPIPTDNDPPIDSRHPQVSKTRSYRGFDNDEDGDGIYLVTGMTFDNDLDNDGIGVTYTGHDFLMTDLGNPATDSGCLAKMELFGTEYQNDNDVYNSLLVGNPGDLFCLNNNGDCDDNDNSSPTTAMAVTNYDLSITGVSGAGYIMSQDEAIICPYDCQASFAAGTTVTLTAIADEGARLESWSGACSGSRSSCTFVMGSNQNVSVRFITDPVRDKPRRSGR